MEPGLAFTCFFCGSELIEKERLSTCTFCGKQEPGDWQCPQGHYNCEECRLASAEEIIRRVCLNTLSPDPWEIATLIMNHPVIPHHGVEHHWLVAPVILTALANKGQTRIEDKKITAALNRTRDIPQGVCGSRGDCGACVGAGAAVSILLKAHYNSGPERGLVLKTVANALMRLADLGGGRCCKQSVYAAVEICALTLKNHLNLDLEIANTTCRYSQKISDCKKETCPYRVKGEW